MNTKKYLFKKNNKKNDQSEFELYRPMNPPVDWEVTVLQRTFLSSCCHRCIRLHISLWPIIWPDLQVNKPGYRTSCGSESGRSQNTTQKLLLTFTVLLIIEQMLPVVLTFLCPGEQQVYSWFACMNKVWDLTTLWTHVYVARTSVPEPTGVD